MDASRRPVSVGFPRISNESSEARDFHPSLVRAAAEAGADVFVESGYGRALGFDDADYSAGATSVHLVDRAASHACDVVVVLRPADDTLDLTPAGSTLVAMLHFPTHKERARRMKELGIDAVALDLIVDDEGARMVEDMKAVAWNGLRAGFGVLARVQPDFYDVHRDPTRVTILGAGMVGKHAVEAATKFGSLKRAERLAHEGLPGVEVATLGRNLSCCEDYVRSRLRATDLLVDATRRSDASSPVVPNEWLASLPAYAVIVDLAVDPYLDEDPPVVRGIEGIPAGDLDRWIFSPDDDAWQTLPRGIPTVNRRWVASCYGWPGLRPVESSAHYSVQIEPLLDVLIRRGGAGSLRPDGGRAERALYRGSLTHWIGSL